MDYTTLLLQEHSRSNTDRIAGMIRNAKDFREIIHIIYNAEAPLPQRASWLLATMNGKQPALLEPYLERFIDTIRDFKVDAVKRNMISVLSRHEIPEALQGRLVEICFELILSRDEPVAVKTMALQCIANVAKEHPELREELKAVIADQLPKTSAAFHSRAKNIMKGW